MRYDTDRDIRWRNLAPETDNFIDSSPRDAKMALYEWVAFIGGGVLFGITAYISFVIGFLVIDEWNRWRVGTLVALIPNIYLSFWFFGELMARNTQLRDLLQQAFDAVYNKEPDTVETVKNPDQLSAALLRDMLIVVLYLQTQYNKNPSSKPWSKRNLSNAPFGFETGTGKSPQMTMVGKISEKNATEISKRLEDMGLIQGRTVGEAGSWTGQDYNDVVYTVLENWKATS